MRVSELITILAVCALTAGLGLWLYLRSRRQTDAEKEQARRLAVNAAGRMTDGVLTEPDNAMEDAAGGALLFYRYSVAGVEYSAAQDVSGLPLPPIPESRWPGSVATVKYDPHRPSNSIVICERWSGLRGAAGEPGSKPGQPHLSGLG